MRAASSSLPVSSSRVARLCCRLAVSGCRSPSDLCVYDSALRMSGSASSNLPCGGGQSTVGGQRVQAAQRLVRVRQRLAHERLGLVELALRGRAKHGWWSARASRPATCACATALCALV
eukprot:359537-Chlamydomonas_euryale.AAC.8